MEFFSLVSFLPYESYKTCLIPLNLFDLMVSERFRLSKYLLNRTLTDVVSTVVPSQHLNHGFPNFFLPANEIWNKLTMTNNKTL